MKHLFTSSTPIVLFLWLIWSISSNAVVNGERKASGPTKLSSDYINNADLYWSNVTGPIEKYVRSKSLEVFREWNSAIEKGDLRSKVSGPCLDVIEHIIRHPLEQEWSAKSMYRILK